MTNKYLYLRINSGLEGFLRIAGMLRRKRFEVNSVSMERNSAKSASVVIGIPHEDQFLRAKNFLEKLVDVTEVKEEKGK